MRLAVLLALLSGSVDLTSQNNTCDSLQCPEGKLCMMVRGKPYCLTERTCSDILCRYDQECKIKNHSPRCVKLADCAKVSCPEGQECRVFGDVARCIKRLTCADLKCGFGEICLVLDDRASCQTTQPCHDLSCPHRQECRIVQGEHRCVPTPSSCEAVYCDAGHTCELFAGVPRCVTKTTCADTKCRYDQRCVVKHGLAACVPVPDTPCGATACQAGHKCIKDGGGPPRCAAELTCDGVQCNRGQLCKLGLQGLPSCEPACESITCPSHAHCEVHLDYAVCVECDHKCPRGQVCKLVDTELVSSLYIAKKTVERCVPIEE